MKGRKPFDPDNTPTHIIESTLQLAKEKLSIMNDRMAKLTATRSKHVKMVNYLEQLYYQRKLQGNPTVTPLNTDEFTPNLN